MLPVKNRLTRVCRPREGEHPWQRGENAGSQGEGAAARNCTSACTISPPRYVHATLHVAAAGAFTGSRGRGALWTGGDAIPIRVQSRAPAARRTELAVHDGARQSWIDGLSVVPERREQR